ncbi:MAG: AMP-binding protein [Ruminococcaceae bacterium]|nr:AMP-binding protein [Oscillospiraceae bacterium]
MITELDFKIKEIAGRIRELREIENFTTAYMAEQTGVLENEYIACENGERDLNFAFLYRCAQAFSVDVTDIIEGQSPTLAKLVLTRKGEGQKIQQAHGMTYYSLAATFKNRISDPLYVEAEYSEKAQHSDIELTTHKGQELDIVIEGALKVQVGDHIEILHAGDTIYYDSSTPHGMIATEGKNCLFYAIVLNAAGEPIPELQTVQTTEGETPRRIGEEQKERVYKKWVSVEKDENRTPIKVDFKNTEKFNFAFDVVDELAKTKPDKLAMIHLDVNKNEKRFTFKEMMELSNKTANYFTSLGIKRHDKVMLVLKRHYEFWPAILGLHKIGAIAIPATNQLRNKDFEYRFNAAGIKAVLCTADDGVPNEVDIAAKTSPTLEIKLVVNADIDGWRNFSNEWQLFSNEYSRKANSPKGDDPMLMFFTSGTSGYPKMALHSYKYPLGHFITAKYWHCVDPDGLHFTISDTGWAKSLWGKLYGQWLSEAATFVYDFDRFHADDILPLFKEYHITTFCAPPTMYRMMIKEDLAKYDLSSVEHATTAGEALNPEVYTQFERLTGLKIMEGFGQSESTLMIGNLTGAKHKIGAMGKPIPIYDIRLIDSDGNEAEPGETGEICVNVEKDAPCGLFMCYYRGAEKSGEVWHSGLYHTGDLAFKDEDGFFWYVGRADDLIKSSGYRIGPFEIENVIMELPYVLECGVSPVPDEVRGQIVKASIVLVKGTEPSDNLKKEIQEYVKKKTAPYKYPRVIEFYEELPKTTSGKIIRSKL